MKPLNLVVLSGYVQENPTVEVSKLGTKFVDFVLELPRPETYPATFMMTPVSCQIFEKTAVDFAISCDKGTLISIVGEISQYDAENMTTNENSRSFVTVQTFNVLEESSETEQEELGEPGQEIPLSDDLPFDC